MPEEAGDTLLGFGPIREFQAASKSGNFRLELIQQLKLTEAEKYQSHCLTTHRVSGSIIKTALVSLTHLPTPPNLNAF